MKPGAGCLIAALLACPLAAQPQVTHAPPPHPQFVAFEVATIKRSDPGSRAGRFLKMETANRFVAKNYTLKLLIAAAYDLNSRTISGGPGWADSDRFDIAAVTPGEVRPDRDEQMRMLRALLEERFQLTFHREPREFAIYALSVAKGGAKLKASASLDAPPVVGPGVVYPQRIVLPGRNATVGDLVSLLQRAILDRPVVDRTGLTGHYDFDLIWAPDETQFGGDVPAPSAETPAPPLFVAMEQQLGLKLEPTRGAVSSLIIESAAQPQQN